MDDAALVERQLGRPPRALRRVVRRCPFGRPAVTEQAPFDADGAPFPTTYYLTCRHLVAALARVEAAGGVERWSAETQRDDALAASRAWADDEQRRRRRALSAGLEHPSLELGVAGSARGGSLKCLHAHAAFALAVDGYELGDRILAELEPLWPERCCSEESRRA